MSVDIGKVSAEGLDIRTSDIHVQKQYKSIGLKKLEIKMENPVLDPRNMTFIYIKDENTSGYLVCEMDRTSAYYGKSLSEIEYLQK